MPGRIEHHDGLHGVVIVGDVEIAAIVDADAVGYLEAARHLRAVDEQRGGSDRARRVDRELPDLGLGIAPDVERGAVGRQRDAVRLLEVEHPRQLARGRDAVDAHRGVGASGSNAPVAVREVEVAVGAHDQVVGGVERQAGDGRPAIGQHGELAGRAGGAPLEADHPPVVALAGDEAAARIDRQAVGAGRRGGGVADGGKSLGARRGRRGRRSRCARIKGVNVRPFGVGLDHIGEEQLVARRQPERTLERDERDRAGDRGRRTGVGEEGRPAASVRRRRSGRAPGRAGRGRAAGTRRIGGLAWAGMKSRTGARHQYEAVVANRVVGSRRSGPETARLSWPSPCIASQTKMRSKDLRSVGLALAIVVGGCTGASLPAEPSCGDAGCGWGPVVTTTFERGAALEGSGPIDVLFVIDDSPAMAGVVGGLAAQYSVFAQAFQALPGAGPPMHAAFISATVPSSDCTPPGPRNGICGLTSPDQFLSTEYCGADQNTTGTLEDTFACLGSFGAQGCGTSQPLEAARRALGGDPSGGALFGRTPFTSPASRLLVAFVTAQDDASMPNGALVPVEDYLNFFAG